MPDRSDQNTQENARLDAPRKDKAGAVSGRMTEARRLAQQALEAERSGDDDRADALFDHAARIDPQAVEEVLSEAEVDRESHAGHEPDATLVTPQQPPGEQFEIDADGERRAAPAHGRCAHHPARRLARPAASYWYQTRL